MTTERAALLPCPFCGSEAVAIRGAELPPTVEEVLTQPLSHAKCTNGQCGARYVPGGFTIEEWNRRALAAQPEGWVSTAERLPEPGNSYLVIAYGVIAIATRYRIHFLGVEGWDTGDDAVADSDRKEGEITHWMPLPSPPAPGAREQDAAGQASPSVASADSSSEDAAEPAPAAPVLPEEPPELVTMRKYGGASTRRSSPILAYIDALRRIAQEQQEQIANAHGVAQACERRAESAEAALAEALPYAKRYRWLRDVGSKLDEPWCVYRPRMTYRLDEDCYDSAIDAAIEGRP